MTEEYNLELQYRRPFVDIWKEEKDDPVLGPLSERMGVRDRGRGPLLVSDEEMEAASMAINSNPIIDAANDILFEASTMRSASTRCRSAMV